MKHLIILPTLLLTLACDAEPPVCTPGPETLTPLFRGLEDLEYYKYINQWDGHPIHASDYAEAITICSEIEDPVLLLSLSAYEAEVSSGRRVAGIASSMYAYTPLWDCLVKQWEANKAIDILPKNP